jgi:hypothetical protein
LDQSTPVNAVTAMATIAAALGDRNPRSISWKRRSSDFAVSRMA